MKVAIDTETDPYESALATVRAAYGVVAAEDGPADDEAGNGTDDYYAGAWNKRRLEKFAGWLADDAAEAIRYVAAHAPAVDIDETIDHMSKKLGFDLSGQQMGGRMASVGFSWKAVRGAKASPIVTDYRSRVYRMDEGIAAVLRDIMGPPAKTD